MKKTITKNLVFLSMVLSMGLSLGFLSGCASVKLVNAPGRKDSAIAPINESTRPGIVKYSLEGSGENVEARRQQAYELMSESCGGDYKIISEDTRVEGKLMRTDGSRGISDPEDHELFIEFECTR